MAGIGLGGGGGGEGGEESTILLNTPSYTCWGIASEVPGLVRDCLYILQRHNTCLFQNYRWWHSCIPAENIFYSSLIYIRKSIRPRVLKQSRMKLILNPLCVH